MRAIQTPRVTYKAAGKPQPVFDNDTGKCIGHIMPSVHPDVLRASPGIQNWSQPDAPKICYQCEQPAEYLFDDSRCGECTRMTPEEVRGDFIDDIDAMVECPACECEQAWEEALLGALGDLAHFRCINCGMGFHHHAGEQ